MQKEIKEKLSYIEEDEHVNILFACESGSRAWGFASPDSDYDIRFIYVRPQNWYLSIENRRDVIEFPLDENDFDVSGWDLRKTLQLLYKSNPPLLEWLQSPIVYKSDREFQENLLTLGRKYFSEKSAGMHYLSIAKGNYKDYFKSNEVKLKKYLYVLRSLFAAEFVVNHGEVPPMEFQKLLEAEQNIIIRPAIEDLLMKKRVTPELGMGERIRILDRYIEQELSRLEEKLLQMPSSENKDVSELDEFFRMIVKNRI